MNAFEVVTVLVFAYVAAAMAAAVAADRRRSREFEQELREVQFALTRLVDSQPFEC